jgi:hypothetical protein
MKRPYALAAAGGLVVVAVVIVYVAFFRASDEEQIHAQLDRLVATARVTEDTKDKNPIAQIARVRGEYKEVFEKEARVNVPELGSARTGREAIADLTMQAGQAFRSADIDLQKLEIKIDETKTTAQVSGVAKLTAVERDGRTRKDERAIDFVLSRAEGSWRIRSITVWPTDEVKPR